VRRLRWHRPQSAAPCLPACLLVPLTGRLTGPGLAEERHIRGTVRSRTDCFMSRMLRGVVPRLPCLRRVYSRVCLVLCCVHSTRLPGASPCLPGAALRAQLRLPGAALRAQLRLPGASPMQQLRLPGAAQRRPSPLLGAPSCSARSPPRAQLASAWSCEALCLQLCLMLRGVCLCLCSASSCVCSVLLHVDSLKLSTIPDFR